MTSTFKHLRAIILLPGVVTIIVPGLLIAFLRTIRISWLLIEPPNLVRRHMDFDTAVKLNIYETLARTTYAPTTNEVAQALNAPIEDVQAAFDRLHQKRLLVPEPDDRSRIRMAPPFSGIETPFRVMIDRKTYYANCVWDSFGIPAALHQDAIIHAQDGFDGEPIQLQIINGQPVPQACVAHFAVPVAQWWKDIVYT